VDLASEHDRAGGQLRLLGSRTRPANFLPHIHRLRGAAILLIVAQHSLHVFDWRGHDLQYHLLLETFFNATVIFMFVAGYLFQYLAPKFTYRTYLVSKLRNVLLPYLLLVTPAIVYVLLRGGDDAGIPDLRGHGDLYRAAWFAVYPGTLVVYALWYIPVITIYYLGSPALLALDRSRYGYWLLVPLTAISIIGHRPTYGSHHNLQLALYFASSYIFGMYLSRARPWADALISRWLWLLNGAYLAVLIGRLVLEPKGGGFQVSHMFSFENGYVDWSFVQQMLLAVNLLGLLKLFNQTKLKTLDYLGEISFTIFFVHLYAIFLLTATVFH
jgi:hypothetical protein